MSIGSVAFEKDLVFNVTVSRTLPGFTTGDPDTIDDRLAFWRRHNTKLGLTGALLVNSDGVALILEGTPPAIAKLRTRVDATPLRGDVHLLAQSACFKRRFGAWPLAYVGPSRWVQRALANHSIADMTAGSPSDAEFLIDLVLSFVGDGA